MTASTHTSGQLSPTTGEPVEAVARRDRIGIWLIIVSDAAGTVALLIAYAYLWSLNVNNAWAPPNNAWAEGWHFWVICAGIAIAAALMWWGALGIARGNRGRLLVAAGVASVVVLLTLVGQIVQISKFPFLLGDGAYASATYWLAFANVLHLVIGLFLTLGVLNRTRAGRITPGDPSQARLIAMWVTWLTIAALLGAIVATTMQVSPNVSPPVFGQFQE